MKKGFINFLFLCFIFLTPDMVNSNNDTNYSHTDFAVEFEKNSIFGFKIFYGKTHGIFGGFKFSLSEPNGKKYSFSQCRAENFYKSQFVGYSDKQYLGANVGYVYTLIEKHVFVFGGLGLLHWRQYRQYYDDTFTVWSKDYWIEDGKKSETSLDVISGTYFKLNSIVFGLGYSTGSSGLVVTIGYGFD